MSRTLKKPKVNWVRIKRHANEERPKKDGIHLVEIREGESPVTEYDLWWWNDLLGSWLTDKALTHTVVQWADPAEIFGIKGCCN